MISSGPDFATLLAENKGLLDSVKSNFTAIESLMVESKGSVDSLESTESLTPPIIFDGNSNNNMEILPMFALKDPTNSFAGGVFPVGDVFTAFGWTTSLTEDVLKEEAGDYAKEVFKNVRGKLKYVAVYQYVDQVLPKFSSSTEFEAGYSDVEVVLFDLWSAKKLGAFRFVAESDSIVNYDYTEGASEESRMLAGTAAAEADLDGKIRWMIKDGLRRITGTEIGYYVEERKGSYFVEQGGKEISRAREN